MRTQIVETFEMRELKLPGFLSFANLLVLAQMHKDGFKVTIGSRLDEVVELILLGKN